jgi:hypothetical protein
MSTFFADFFDIDEAVLQDFGAFNVSLINDLPLYRLRATGTSRCCSD